MNRFRLIPFAIFLLQTLARASDELPIRFLYEDAPDRLTTEKVWVIDSDEINPHRQRWILQRQIELVELAAIETQPGRYGIKTAGLIAKTRGYYRGAGPWFQSDEKFTCEPSPAPGYATEAGTQRAVKSAKTVWENLLKESRVKLELAFKAISEKTPLAAQAAGIDAFERWKAEINLEWRGAGKTQVRKEEWADYWVEARVAKRCEGGVKATGTPPSWESMMEPPPESTAVQPPKILARAPARRWNGLFSIRATVHAGGRKLTGQFLLDSTLRNSVINPLFLKSQGLDAQLLKEPGSRSLRVHWSGGGGVGYPISIDHLDVAGHGVGLQRFMAVEAELFTPPESISTCCDGILGADFFRRHILEFKTDPSPSVVIWSRAGYRYEGRWIEAAFTGDGTPVSGCQLVQSGTVLDPRSLFSVKWDTGADVSVDIHPEIKKTISQYSQSRWNLECASSTIATGLTPDSREDEKNGAIATQRIPAATIGMRVLALGPVVFDFPHGRIWFSKQAISGVYLENRSGVSLEYVFIRGDRELRVKDLRKGTAADGLIQSGLRPGMLVEKIDGREITELDEWEVDRKLAGAYGKQVVLEWTSNRKTKSVGLQLK